MSERSGLVLGGAKAVLTFQSIFFGQLILATSGKEVPQHSCITLLLFA